MSTLDVPINVNVGNVFEPLLTSRQAAPLIHLHYKTLERMARTGMVPATKQGKCWLFRASKLNNWINAALDLNTANPSQVNLRAAPSSGSQSEITNQDEGNLIKMEAI
jgi:excisionase family DNA binding protein